MDITDIKKKNLNAIMDILRFHDGLTKKDVAQMAGLSFSTVSNMCNELKNQQILSEEKIGSSAAGRIPGTIQFLYKSFCGICINLQMKDEMEFAILNFRNEVLFRHSYDISPLKTPEEIVAFSHEIFLRMKSFPWTRGITFIGVAVAVSACYDRGRDVVVRSAVPVLENAPLRCMVARTFGLPAYVENEANACVISALHDKKQRTDILYLHLSQGVGLGVICGGALLRGKHGLAAQLSHVPLGNPKAVCPVCASPGCLEADMSLRGMLGDFPGELSAQGIHGQWEELVGLVGSSPGAYLPYLEDKGRRLGALCGILASVFDPEQICIGGEIAALEPYLKDFIEPCLSPACAPQPRLLWDKASDTTILNGLNQRIYEEWQPFE